MAKENLVSGYKDNIFLLLSHHTFTIKENDSDDFKCIVCRRILTNARQATCGCRYCLKCVDKRVTAGEMFCPGFTEECRIANLSDAVPDHRANREVSQLIVKCPEEPCNFEGQLIIMGDHLRFCSNKGVACPFNYIGCDREKQPLERLDEHMLKESIRHSEILVGVIGNLRNEIDRLVKCDTEKGATIESMKEEMRSMKLENAVRIENILDGKCDKTAMEIESRCVREKIDLIATKLEEMKREWSGEMERMAMVYAEEREKDKIDVVEKCFAENINIVDCVMIIGDITAWRSKPENKFSEYTVLAYKIRLRCYPCYNSIGDDQLAIQLYIYAGENDGSLQWPFERDVTITIANQMCRKTHKSITKHCTIVKPSNDPFKCSEYFIFKWSELIEGGILQNERVVLRCFIG